MKFIRFDSVGGASGDMILAALLDLGCPAERLRDALAGLGIESFELDVQSVSRDGQRGTQVHVRVPPEHYPHRTLPDIRRILEGSTLDPAVKAMAVQVFERLAAAEAAVHGTTADQVHFHEVGAMDAIVDIAGACLALSLLDIQGVALSPLPVGSGTTQCAHGAMPLPVPATAELLRGFAVTLTDEPHELVTPTGAALLTAWSKAWPVTLPPTATCVFSRAGIGIGHRTLASRSNSLRASLFELRESAPSDLTCCVLETNVDDTSPELLGSLTEQLLADGALDVFTTPIQMKRQRPGTLLTVLCRHADRAAFMDRIFAESTTFGIREHTVSRTVLHRRHELRTTAYGDIRIKIGSYNGRDITRSPEHADCVRCAREHQVSVRAVYEDALRKA